MTKQFNYSDNDSWDWKEKTPFAQSVAVGNQVFISGQQTLDANGVVLDSGDIAAQTRNVFENMKKALAQVGLQLDDLVRLNTYYVFDGPDEDATEYWEDMTKVRLEYFPNPGPAATAVRIKGLPYPGQLIQIEGIAVKNLLKEERNRIMPKDSWDWSIAVPLSQGWKIGQHVFVGGQISADVNGVSVDVGNLDAQTRNIYRYIGNVLLDAGLSFEDLVHVKICFKHGSRDFSGTPFVERIMNITKEFIVEPGPVVTAFGVDLLYPGLDLEIDAMAITDSNRKSLSCSDFSECYQLSKFSIGVSAHGEIYVGGQTALTIDGLVLNDSDMEKQARIVFERMHKVLAKFGATLDDVVKLNIFIVSNDTEISRAFHTISNIWAEMAPKAHPAMTPVRVHELTHSGLLVQADCIALK